MSSRSEYDDLRCLETSLMMLNGRCRPATRLRLEWSELRLWHEQNIDEAVDKQSWPQRGHLEQFEELPDCLFRLDLR